MSPQKQKNHKINKIVTISRLTLLALLLPSLYFSYYPLIPLASTATMNLELSLPLIFLFLFSLVSIPSVFFYIKNTKKSWPPLLFPIFSTLSLLWTENLLRGILTVGILICIYISIFSIIEIIKEEKYKCCKNYNIILIKIFIYSTLAVCTFCWLQCILDVFGAPRESTLLCLGCTSLTFGFPHPSGFAIEPQFMGNLLLAPSLLSLYYLKHSKKKSSILFSFFVISTLFLTFSRGAIYSFAVALAVLLVVDCVKTKSFTLLKTLPVVIFAFILSLVAQGTLSVVSYTDDTFLSGVSKSISQLSLGKINIPYKKSTPPVENPVENSTSQGNDTPPQSDAISSIFDGYVEESTDTRVLLSSLAISAWTDSFSSFLVGYGLGSSGVVINRFFPDLVDSKEIIQNELFAIALELGLFGLILAAFSLFLIIKHLLRSKNFSLLFSIIVAFILSLLFFSGLPNALHIYLFPPLIFSLFPQKSQKTSQKK